mmetsp:Transcript_85/g.293  ORF Transcript_85/g.293 Transcript_85/m.293 type:complete len:233 (+) Transcript_85:94-792(+)
MTRHPPLPKVTRLEVSIKPPSPSDAAAPRSRRARKRSPEKPSPQEAAVLERRPDDVAQRRDVGQSPALRLRRNALFFFFRGRRRIRVRQSQGGALLRCARGDDQRLKREAGDSAGVLLVVFLAGRRLWRRLLLRLEVHEALLRLRAHLLGAAAAALLRRFFRGVRRRDDRLDRLHGRRVRRGQGRRRDDHRRLDALRALRFDVLGARRRRLRLRLRRAHRHRRLDGHAGRKR